MAVSSVSCRHTRVQGALSGVYVICHPRGSQKSRLSSSVSILKSPQHTSLPSAPEFQPSCFCPQHWPWSCSASPHSASATLAALTTGVWTSPGGCRSGLHTFLGTFRPHHCILQAYGSNPCSTSLPELYHLSWSPPNHSVVWAEVMAQLLIFIPAYSAKVKFRFSHLNMLSVCFHFPHPTCKLS